MDVKGRRWTHNPICDGESSRHRAERKDDCSNNLGWMDARIAHGVIQSMTYGICELSKT
jgi:hypothetical protein